MRRRPLPISIFSVWTKRPRSPRARNRRCAATSSAACLTAARDHRWRPAANYGIPSQAPGSVWVCRCSALGGYLIADQLQNPFEAQSAGLLFAALLIATAITLLFGLLHPSRKPQRRVSVWPATASQEEKTVLIARCSTGRSNGHTSGDPLHGRYVDRAR